MGRWVLLRHVLADGGSHLDWMMEQPPPSAAAAGLLSFRLAAGVDPRVARRFEAERIGEHRREYLEYEGPVSGDRGEVRRVADGECQVEVGADMIRIDLGAGRRLVGTGAGKQGVWVFELASAG